MATTGASERSGTAGKQPLNQLEFFSGIGGMRVALKQALEGHPDYYLGWVYQEQCDSLTLTLALYT